MSEVSAEAVITTQGAGPEPAFLAAFGESASVTVIPNAKGGSTFGIHDQHGSYIQSFIASKDLIDMRVALEKAGVNVVNFNLPDPSFAKHPGDAFVSYIADNQASYIVVMGQDRKLGVSLTVNGFVRLGDIVGSGWD